MLMSYCVNCGVELDPSLKSCPLCHTPVINPSQLQTAPAPSPYSLKKGQVDVVKKKDLALLLVIVLGATALSCLDGPWSLFIIGACLLLFVMAIPAVIYTKLPIYVSLLFDGIAVGIYLYLITFNTKSSDWFTGLALPILVLITILVEIFALLLRSFRISFLTTALYFFAEAALLCVGIELLIQHFSGIPPHPVWSAVVLTVCSVIVVTLITLLSRRRLRDAVRRRLHF